MQEINGMVKDLQVKGLDEATVVTVEYEVNSKIYTIKESLKYETKSFKLGFLPIGQKKIPKVKCEVGKSVVILYNPDKPDKGHIKGNDGIINC